MDTRDTTNPSGVMPNHLDSFSSPLDFFTVLQKQLLYKYFPLKIQPQFEVMRQPIHEMGLLAGSHLISGFENPAVPES